MLGFIPEGDEVAKYEDDWDNDDILHGYGEMIVGEMIAECCSDDYMPEEERPVSDIVEAHHRIAKKHGVDLDRIAIHTGMRAC
jgi:hypothetical protein